MPNAIALFQLPSSSARRLLRLIPVIARVRPRHPCKLGRRVGDTGVMYRVAQRNIRSRLCPGPAEARQLRPQLVFKFPCLARTQVRICKQHGDHFTRLTSWRRRGSVNNLQPHSICKPYLRLVVRKRRCLHGICRRECRAKARIVLVNPSSSPTGIAD